MQLGDLNIKKLIPDWSWEWKPHKEDTSNVERFAWVSRDLDVSVHDSDGRFRFRTDVNIQGMNHSGRKNQGWKPKQDDIMDVIKVLSLIHI